MIIRLFDPYTDPVIMILQMNFFKALCSTYYDSCAGRKSCFFCSMEKTGKEKSKISMCHRHQSIGEKWKTIKEATGAAIRPHDLHMKQFLLRIRFWSSAKKKCCRKYSGDQPSNSGKHQQQGGATVVIAKGEYRTYTY